MINIENYFASMHKAIEKMDFSEIEKAINIIVEKIETNKSIFVCGNGGSALTASHYVTDWNKSYVHFRNFPTIIQRVNQLEKEVHSQNTDNE